MDLFDIAMKYGQRRLDDAMQPFSDTEGYIEDRFGNAKPKSTTINYNEDGTQTITNKVDVTPQATPAPAAQPQPFGIQAQPQAQAFGIQPPAMPSAMPQAQFQPVNLPATMPGATAQPAMATAPVAPDNVMYSDIQGQEVELPAARARMTAPTGTMPTGAPVEEVTAPVAPTPTVAAPAPTPKAEAPVTAPVAPPAPGTAPQPNVAPPATVQPVTAPAPVVTAEPAVQPAAWQKDLESAGSDTRKLAAIYAREDYPEEARKLASERWRAELAKKDEEAKLNKIVTDAAKGDPKASNDLAKYLKSRSDEGSYIKAVLLARLGLNDLAKEEQQKLAGGNFENTIVGNQAYTVERNNFGAISRAWDSKGQAVDDEVVAKINASSMPTKGSVGQAGATRVRDAKGTEWSVVPTTRGSIFFDSTGNQGVPAGKTVPIQGGTDVDLQRDISLMKARVKLEGVKAEDRVRALETVNRDRIKEGLAPFSTSEIGLDANGRFVTQGGGVAPAAPTEATTAPAVTAPATTTPAAAARPSGPVAPGAAVPTTPSAPAPAVTAPASTGVAPGTGGSTAEIIRRREELSAGRQKTATVVGEATGQVQAKDIKNQAFADSSYSLIKPISDAIKDSTGSTLGTGVDTVAGAIGKSTKGAQAIAKLDVLGYSLVSNVPRFEGPQGVRDVEIYERAAGDLANSKKPVETRLAALDAIITLMKKYDKEGKNDWTFGEGATTGGPADKARAELERRRKEKK